MASKQCDKCGETVDEARAFCPGCGNAFVEEHERQTTSFDAMDNTVQFGQTAYNMLLSDMGLNISKPQAPEKKIEVIEALPVPAAVPGSAPQPTPPPVADQVKPSGKMKWFIVAGVVVVVFGVLLVVTAAILLYYFGQR